MISLWRPHRRLAQSHFFENDRLILKLSSISAAGGSVSRRKQGFANILVPNSFRCFSVVDCYFNNSDQNLVFVVVFFEDGVIKSGSSQNDLSLSSALFVRTM